MKKRIILGILAVMFSFTTISIHAEDIDSQIAQLEETIAVLESERDHLIALRDAENNAVVSVVNEEKSVDEETEVNPEVVETAVNSGTEEYLLETSYYEIYYNEYDDAVEYEAVVTLTNSSNHDIKISDCTFDLESSQGNLLSTTDMLFIYPKVISPGESCYIWNTFGTEIPDGSVDEEYILIASPDTKSTDVKSFSYEVSDVSLSKSAGYPTIIGRITNTSGKDQSYYYLSAVFFDENGKAIGMSGTSVDDFMAGQTKSFELTTMMSTNPVSKGEFASYEIIAKDYN